MLYRVKLGTITNAQRARSVLKQRGVKSNIVRIQNPNKSDGCGYALKINTDNIDEIVSIIREEGIHLTGVETV